ncbi:hybrid sensor histidine kinase/response regulator [Ktedonosporobacter rubrisoli]|uniref:histidine kinase n=1 Tax=Ktedonosporobacter rubrisoli TaxID=2509675 RepID=A0A4P6K0G3_KTERU|nr:hybrid sensor histidine kinase/response regulator [Ktedonosporobacter rubrisoli]QBD81678.1 hybrid sensor histidine kinase/response regulator [Ktedonosporobacter rubrisoli]
MNTPYILVVDDDPALLQALPRTLDLRLNNIKVDTCDNAQKALELVPENDYDAIVSDVKMPGMDGLELLARIQELRPETPVILITGHGEHNLAIQALRGGAYDYILKPIDRDVFVAAVQRAVQTRHLRRQVEQQHLALSLHAKSLERLVQKRTSELVEANATKDKFLQIVAHEIKAPLSNLRGMAQVLHQQSEQPDNHLLVQQGLVDMERAVERTEVLVQDLLDTSLMETNMFILQRRRCDLVELCRHLLNSYTAGAGPTLTYEIIGKPVEAEVDEERISQVLINLLSNARKYSPKGSPITVTLQQSGYEVIISVRDMGVGIPPEAIAHIFEQFYRAPGVEVQSGSRPGLGVGLFITRKIVERHGGRVEVQSLPGQGSIFSMTLPLFIDPSTNKGEATLEPHTQAVWTIVH